MFRGWRSSGLQRLSLWGFQVDTDILADIIIHHPELEELRYMTATDWTAKYQIQLANLKLPIGSIPKLRSFQGPREMKVIFEEIRDQKMVTEKGHENYGNPRWEFKSAGQSHCNSPNSKRALITFVIAARHGDGLTRGIG